MVELRFRDVEIRHPDTSQLVGRGSFGPYSHDRALMCQRMEMEVYESTSYSALLSLGSMTAVLTSLSLRTLEKGSPSILKTGTKV